jgi:putative membrane protein
VIKLIKLLVFLLLIVLGAAFAVLNSQIITLDFYFSVIDLPVSVVIVAFMSIGALLGVIASSGIMLRLKHENRVLKRKARMVNEEVRNLRTMPIRDQ